MWNHVKNCQVIAIRLFGSGESSFFVTNWITWQNHMTISYQHNIHLAMWPSARMQSWQKWMYCGWSMTYSKWKNPKNPTCQNENVINLRWLLGGGPRSPMFKFNSCLLEKSLPRRWPLRWPDFLQNIVRRWRSLDFVLSPFEPQGSRIHLPFWTIPKKENHDNASKSFMGCFVLESSQSVSVVTIHGHVSLQTHHALKSSPWQSSRIAK